MPDYEIRASAIANQRSHAQFRSIGIARCCQTARASCQVRWGYFGEVAKKLEFTVFGTGDVAGFCQGRTIVVGGVSVRISEVTPVSATEDLSELVFILVSSQAHVPYTGS